MEKFYAQYTAFISDCKNKNKAPSVMELMYYILAQDGELRRAFQDMGHNPDDTLSFLQKQFKLSKLIIPEELNSIPPIISRLPLQIYTVTKGCTNRDAAALGNSALFIVCVEVYCKHMQTYSPVWNDLYTELGHLSRELSERIGYTLSRENIRVLTAFGFWPWVSDPQGCIRVTNPGNPMETLRIAFATTGDGTQTVELGSQQGSGSVSALKAFCTNLSDDAKQGKLSPIVGRDAELKQVLETLLRKTKNCPVLLGDPGTGKTAIVEALALATLDPKTPSYLYGLDIYVLDMAALMAGTSYRGQLEERIKRLIAEVENTPQCVIFIDEIHMLIGRKDDPMNLANLLKPALSRGRFSCIGATTYEEYRQFIEPDKALARRFNPIFVREPTPQETRQLLDSAAKTYGEFHKVEYPREVLDLVVTLSEKYITNARFPDKALDILDSAGIKAHLRACELPTEEQSSLQSIKQDLQRCMSASQDGTSLRDALQEMKDSLNALSAKLEQGTVATRAVVSAEDVYNAVSQKTNIPTSLMAVSLNPNTLIEGIERELHENVIGQDSVLANITKHLKRGVQHLLSPERPQGAMLFAGPTGVGKTLTAKMLARHLYPGKDNFVKLDMSEYMEKHTISRLVGAPPGYVGHENAGYLSDKLRRNPHSLILVDEIDKAHQDVLNIFLQILEDGEFTDGKGITVNCRQSFFVFTTNVGDGTRKVTKSVGFGGGEESAEVNPYDALSGYFKPEFLNRMDGILFFNELTTQDLKAIFQLELGKLRKRLHEHHKELSISDDFLAKTVENITGSANTGAREVRRLVEGKITDIVAEKLLKSPEVDTVSLTAKDA